MLLTITIIANIFDDYKATTLPMSTLNREIRERLAVTESTAYNCIVKCPVVERISGKGKGKSVRLLDGHRDIIDEMVSAQRKQATRRKTIRDRMQELIPSLLQASPDRQLPLLDLVMKVRSSLDCSPTTVYSYVDDLSNVKKVKIDGVVYCSLVNPFDKLADLEFVDDPHLENELRRAFKLLAPDTIDFGVFQFGRIMESTIRDYLILGRDCGTLNVKDGHLKNLRTMIDCLAMNGIIRDRATLAFLRETRNDPAHNLTTAHEREKLMEDAQLPVRLFMQVIQLIHTKTQELRALKCSMH